MRRRWRVYLPFDRRVWSLVTSRFSLWLSKWQWDERNWICLSNWLLRNKLEKRKEWRPSCFSFLSFFLCCLCVCACACACTCVCVCVWLRETFLIRSSLCSQEKKNIESRAKTGPCVDQEKRHKGENLTFLWSDSAVTSDACRRPCSLTRLQPVLLPLARKWIEAEIGKPFEGD